MNTENIQPLALRRVAAAATLGVSPTTLDRLTIRGLIKTVPGSGGTRGVVKLYSMIELQRFLREGFAVKAA